MAKTRLRYKLNTVNMIICLTGFMGCGKSSVGRRLSQLLCCPFTDLDDVIGEKAGKTIPDIFKEDGEQAFRSMELNALSEILVPISLPSSTGLVLALGGGTVTTPGCAEIVKERTICVYLRASLETLVENLRNEASGRPMLNITAAMSGTNPEEALRSRIIELMDKRSSIYEKTAHIMIDTDGKSIETIVQEIISLLS